MRETILAKIAFYERTLEKLEETKNKFAKTMQYPDYYYFLKGEIFALKSLLCKE